MGKQNADFLIDGNFSFMTAEIDSITNNVQNPKRPSSIAQTAVSGPTSVNQDY